jgi:hypothetical protein
MKDAYRPVPVQVARTIAEEYQKSCVIVLAYDPVYGLLHTTTYGSDPENKAWAAQGGQIAAKALGTLPEKNVDFEDYRLDQSKKLLSALNGVMAQIQSGALVRKTADDEAPGWGMRQLPLVLALNTADKAIREAETFLGSQQEGEK